MGAYYLGLPFDIHGGGQDLIFPHHENEIAQSSAAYGVETPVKYWLHNGFLTIESDKMSKSLGNFRTAREVLDNYDPQAVRLFLISGHYRQPLDYNAQALEQAKQSVERLRNAADTLRGKISILEKRGSSKTDADMRLDEATKKAREGFEREMDDDFNTPGALAEIFAFVRAINTYTKDAGKTSVLRRALFTLREMLSVLGIDLEAKDKVGAGASSAQLGGVVELLLEIRESARKNKDWAMADMIRDRLKELGIVVADTKDGPVWKLQ